MRFFAYGLILGFAAKDWKWRKVLYKRRLNQLRTKAWPLTAPIEAKIGVRRMSDTFPESWLTKPYNSEEES